MTTELMDLAAAGLGLLSAFLEIGTAVLMAHGLAARRLGEGGRPIAQEEERIAWEETSPFRRFTGWTPHRRSRRRYGRRSDSA